MTAAGPGLSPEGGAAPPGNQRFHASAVEVAGAGVLILGASGSGKSSLALSLIGLGAALIADDHVLAERDAGGVMLWGSASLRGVIEARGLGLLRTRVAEHPVPLALCIDLDRTETERLPPWRSMRVLERDIALLHAVESAYFPAAIIQYVTYGREE